MPTVSSNVRVRGAGSTGRRNTGVKSLLLGVQIARSQVVVHLAGEPLCSDRLASAATSRCPSESTVSAGRWCSVRPALPRALRIAKIDVDFGRQRQATMIRKFLSPVPGQGLIQLLW